MAKLRAIIDGFSGPAPPSPQAPAPQAPQVQPVTRGSRRPDPLEPGLLPEDRRPAPQEGVLPTLRRAVRPNLNPVKPELWSSFIEATSTTRIPMPSRPSQSGGSFRKEGKLAKGVPVGQNWTQVRFP